MKTKTKTKNTGSIRAAALCAVFAVCAAGTGRAEDAPRIVLRDEPVDVRGPYGSPAVPLASTMLRLDDGSVLRGAVVGESDESLTLDTPHGTLLVPLGDIRAREAWKDPVVVSERWIFADAAGDARVVSSVSAPPSAAGPFVVPVEGRVLGVTQADGGEVRWESVEAGPVSIATIHAEGGAAESFEIECAVANPLSASDAGLVFLRAWQPDAAGLLRVEFIVPHGWSASFPMGACDVARVGDRIVVRRDLRKQEPFQMKVVFIVGSSG